MHWRQDPLALNTPSEPAKPPQAVLKDIKAITHFFLDWNRGFMAVFKEKELFAHIRTFGCKVRNVVLLYWAPCPAPLQELEADWGKQSQNGGNKSVRVMRNGSFIFTIVLHSCHFPWSRNHLQAPAAPTTPPSCCSVCFILKERHENNLPNPIKAFELEQRNVTFNPISFNDKSAQLQHFLKNAQNKETPSNYSVARDKISATGSYQWDRPGWVEQEPLTLGWGDTAGNFSAYFQRAAIRKKKKYAVRLLPLQAAHLCLSGWVFCVLLLLLLQFNIWVHWSCLVASASSHSKN